MQKKLKKQQVITHHATLDTVIFLLQDIYETEVGKPFSFKFTPTIAIKVSNWNKFTQIIEINDDLEKAIKILVSRFYN